MAQRIWVMGTCWRCDQDGLPVMWLGPVHTSAGDGPFFACEACIARLEQLVRTHLRPSTARTDSDRQLPGRRPR